MPVISWKLSASDDEGLGYGASMMTFSVQVPVDGKPATVGNGSHICFGVEGREIVDLFYEKAMELGATSDGEPGLRPKYDENYYGAFVRDPDGNKIEAVTYSAN